MASRGVKLIRDFILPCSAGEFYGKILGDLEMFLNKTTPQWVDHYEVKEEIKETGRFYRRSVLTKTSYLNYVPAMIKDQIPIELFESAVRQEEESIFELADQKIRWRIQPLENPRPLYTLTGSTTIIPLNEASCKVTMLMYFDLDRSILEEKYVSKNVSVYLVPILESHLPGIILDKMKGMYSDLVGS